MKLSIVIPLYNEESNVKPLIGKILETITEAAHDPVLNGKVEFVLVDNGSVDQTRSNLEELTKEEPSIRLCYVDKNIGYGNGILQGLMISKGEVLAWTHADLQTDPKDALVAYNKFIQYSDSKCIVKGKRKGRKLSEAFFTWGMQQYVRFKLHVSLSDINAQPKLFPKEFFDSHIQGKAPLDFSLDLFLLIQAQKLGYKTLTIPVIFNKRHSGEAKGGGSFKTKFKLINRTIKYINAYK